MIKKQDLISDSSQANYINSGEEIKVFLQFLYVFLKN